MALRCDRNEAVFHFLEARGIEAHGLAEAGQGARRFLQAVRRLLHLVGDRLEVGDLRGQRLEEVQRPGDLRERGRFVVFEEGEGAGRGLDHLPRVGEDGSLLAQAILLGGIEARGGDLFDLVAEEVEPQGAIALRGRQLVQLRRRRPPFAVCGARGGEHGLVAAEVVEQLAVALSRHASM